MIRIAAAVLCLGLAACSTTSTVHQPFQPPAGQTWSYSFTNEGGDNLEAIELLDTRIRARLQQEGLLAEGAPARLDIVLTHFYLRSNGARFMAGIMAGRDKIISNVRLSDASGAVVGNFEVETTNASAWGTSDGLMTKHVDEIVARLR